jgi:pentapeptide MXKDX repeat protein
MRRWIVLIVVALVATISVAGHAQTPGDKMKDEKMMKDDKMKAKHEKMMKDDKMKAKHDKMMKDDKMNKDDKMEKMEKK